MPILRAGPWGNLTDSFQGVPLNTSGQLSYYPVNCAKTDWPSQTWTAYYEVAAGCCSPSQIEVTFPYTDDFLTTVQYYTTTIGISEDCTYLFDFPSATYHDPAQQVFELYYLGSNTWEVYFGNEYFAYWDRTSFTADECDPITSFTISGGENGYYDGYDITISQP